MFYINVKSTELYYVIDDIMVVNGKKRTIDNVHGVVGFDMPHFYDTLLEIYDTYN